MCVDNQMLNDILFSFKFSPERVKTLEREINTAKHREIFASFRLFIHGSVFTAFRQRF